MFDLVGLDVPKKLADVSERGLLSLLVLATVAPVIILWTVDFIPSQDGPAHIYLAKLLNELWFTENSAFTRLFEINLELVPNSFYYVVAALLLNLLQPDVVEKLLGSIFLIGWPLACFYALKPVSKFPIMGTIFLLPLAFSQLFAMGFYNYCFALLFVMIGLGLWFRTWLYGKRWNYLLLALLGLIAYVTHLFPATNLLFIVGTTTIIAAVAGQFGHRDVGRFAVFCRQHLLLYFVILLPTFVAILFYLFQNLKSVGVGAGSAYEFEIVNRLVYLGGFLFYVVYSHTDSLFGGLLWIAIALMSYRTLAGPLNLSSAPAKYFGPLSLIYLALFLLMPATLAQSSFITDRLFPILYCVFIIFAASNWQNGRKFRNLAIFATIIVLATSVYRYGQYQKLDDYLQQYYDAGSQMKPGKSVLAIPAGQSEAQQYGSYWHPFVRVITPLHVSARYATKHDLLELKLVQSHFQYVPITYKKSFDPFIYLPSLPAGRNAEQATSMQQLRWLQAPPQQLDLAGYEEKTGINIDYILLWGTPEHFWAADYNPNLRGQIENRYQRIELTNAPDIMLFERKSIRP